MEQKVEKVENRAKVSVYAEIALFNFFLSFSVRALVVYSAKPKVLKSHQPYMFWANTVQDLSVVMSIHFCVQ